MKKVEPPKKEEIKKEEPKVDLVKPELVSQTSTVKANEAPKKLQISSVFQTQPKKEEMPMPIKKKPVPAETREKVGDKIKQE